MRPQDVVPYLATLRGRWLSGQELPEDGRTPTPTQLLDLPAAPAILGANILVGTEDDDSHDPEVQKILADHATNGGLISLCTHPPNFFFDPRDLTSAWVSDTAAPKPDLARLLWGKGQPRKRYIAAMDRAIAYIKTLPSDAPIIFRPWHEPNGDWFWWGVDHTNPNRSAAGVRALWADTIARVKAACPNVLSGWSTGMTFQASASYGYPTATVPDIVGCSLYSDTMDFGHFEDYATLVATGRPLLLFEVGPGVQRPGWPATRILAALVARYPRIAGWVSWQDDSSLLLMADSAAVLADPRVLTREDLP
jgi:mannan endo-1,4-beta-mannosidase